MTRDLFHAAYRAARLIRREDKTAAMSALADEAIEPFIAQAMLCWARRHEWPGGGIAHARRAPDFSECVRLHLRAVCFRQYRAGGWRLSAPRLP